jgi:tetratricopeptide (TPR) repeat protein
MMMTALSRRRGTIERFTALLVAGLLAVLSACGPGAKAVSVPAAEGEREIGRAEALVSKGHYRGFKEAVGIYRELYGRTSLKAKVTAPYFEALLLLAMRQKDVGIDDPALLREAAGLAANHPDLAGLRPYLTVISRLPVRTRGVMRDIDTSSWNKAAADELRAAQTTLARNAATSEFAASVLAARFCSLGRYSEGWRDPAEFLKAFPDSPLVRYEFAVCHDDRPELMAEILARDPDFAEARFHLGEAALREGKLLEAESDLLKVYEAIPESPQARILLASIYLATEEFDKSLEFYDLTLAVSPEYRDALLGKAICLSYLGRGEEAIQVLGRIIDLGYWLLGEAHYWTAWNLHALKRNTEALEHADEAKGRLPTNSEVFGLAGSIALELGENDRAEKDFLESLKYNAANTESLFGLGTIEGRRSRWAGSGAYYEKAGAAYASSEAALRAKIEEIRSASLSEARKARLIRKRESQIERARLNGATSYYNAAASYANAELGERAAACAAKAAAHAALKAKAEELLQSIKK